MIITKDSTKGCKKEQINSKNRKNPQNTVIIKWFYANNRINQRLIITNSTLLFVSRSFSVSSSFTIFSLAPIPL